ncbi:porin family protein [Flagellimonas flava]|uniref:Outer membrane protein beta-barrel domain-containing protein n=1 Tax=Flagellimonas flava TaxID=570519 RepID=A0A1M5LQT8_9FLAO|nr:porin family protein [Allomuricauda flava]SHG67447.1 Outer membrane protein beta-barrel domain-containing protein [Allomuricauda flava]
MRSLSCTIAILCLVLGGTGTTMCAQSISEVDSKYLEDQFYIGLGFNFLLDRPSDVVQRNLSYNLQMGFIKDIPLNSDRDFGLGLGLGYSVNSYYTNLVASNETNTITYEVRSTEDFTRSKLETHAIEFPLEVRWRTSTPADYKFWRIYAGGKIGYVFSGRSRLVTDENGAQGFSNNDIQKLQYGLTLSFGYNTWNINAYYALNPLLEDSTSLNGTEPIDTRVLRIGVIFYIL